MTAHVSVRLPWHDRGWDGHICDRPRENVYRAGNRSVNAERIRSDKDTAAEERARAATPTRPAPTCPPVPRTLTYSAPPRYCAEVH